MTLTSPAKDDALTLRFWGVRGSTPTSGPETAEFGGNTPCLEVRCGERLFVIDAGSGLGAFGRGCRDELPKEIDLLFSHLHLDHSAGLPFFKPAVLDAERTIHTYCGNLDGESAQASLDRLFSPPLFPVTLDILPCTFRHHGFRAGEPLHFSDGSKVDTILLDHPQGSTGFRFDHAGKRLCVISDIEHGANWPDPTLLRFVEGADLIVYDGMFTEGEYPCCKGWGHSTWQKGVELAQAARAKALAIIHLHPCHSDAQLRVVEAEMQAEMPTAFIARERQSIEVGRPLVALAEPPVRVVARRA